MKMKNRFFIIICGSVFVLLSSCGKDAADVYPDMTGYWESHYNKFLLVVIEYKTVSSSGWTTVSCPMDNEENIDHIRKKIPGRSSAFHDL